MNTAPVSRSYLSGVALEEDLVDVELVGQVELNARAVFQHPETDGVFAADEFLFGIDADVQVVIKQVVIGAEGPVSAAQHIQARGNGSAGIAGGRGTFGRRLGGVGLLSRLSGAGLTRLAGKRRCNCKTQNEKACCEDAAGRAHGPCYPAGAAC